MADVKPREQHIPGVLTPLLAVNDPEGAAPAEMPPVNPEPLAGLSAAILGDDVDGELVLPASRSTRCGSSRPEAPISTFVSRNCASDSTESLKLPVNRDSRLSDLLVLAASLELPPNSG